MPNENKTGRIEYIYNVYEMPRKQGIKKQGIENLGVEFQGVGNQGQLITKEPITNNKDNIYSPAQKGKCICLNGQMETTKKETKRFTPPTVDEVKAYCRERNNNIDAEYFVDYYEARNWELNKGRKVKDWKACVRTWEHNDFKRNGKKTNIETNQSFGDELTRSQDDLCRMIGFNV
jgi:hypothetical protein